VTATIEYVRFESVDPAAPTAADDPRSSPRASDGVAAPSSRPRHQCPDVTVWHAGKAAISSAVPDPRPISAQNAQRIRTALAGVRAAQDALEKAVARALLDGASVRAVSELGMSPNTVQKYGRAHGWPTEENRLRFNESRWDRYGREDDDDDERSGT
jgi:hypothetical protein